MSAEENSSGELELSVDRFDIVARDEPPDQLLAQVLRQLFQQVASARQLSQNRYAARIYQSPTSVSRWLHGKRVPPAQFVEQLIRDVEAATGMVIPPGVRTSIENLHVRALAAMSPAAAREQEYVYQLHQAQVRIEEADVTIQLLQAKVVSLQEAVNQRDVEIERITGLHLQAESRATEIISDYEDRIQRLEGEREELDADLTRMKVSVERYEAERERARQESVELEDALTEMQHSMEITGVEDLGTLGVVVEPNRQPEVWERIPLRNKNFTGREQELQRLRERLRSTTQLGMPQVVVLEGMIGVGKTQLAIEYVWRYRSAYDLVCWIAADQPSLVRSSLAGMAPALGFPTATATGIEEAASSVVKALGQGVPYRRWLLVFDNAVDPEDLLDSLPRGQGHVLITSRDPEWAGPYEVHRIDCLTRPESIAFLRKRLGVDVGREADQLAEELGDLPLALEQAAAFQSRTGMSIREYSSLLQEDILQLLSMRKPHDYPHVLPAACRLSMAQLEEQLPEAAQVMRWCAFFGPAPVPRPFFRRPLLHSQLRDLLPDPLLLSRILGELQRLALIRLDSSTGTIHVHRLVQALVRAYCPEAEREELRHHVHLLMEANTPRTPEDPSNWPTLQALALHVIPAGLSECAVPDVRHAALRIARYQYLSGNYDGARTLLHATIDSGTKHGLPDVFIARRHLADLLLALGEYPEAYALAGDNVAALRAEFGPEHSETLAAASGLGKCIRAQGRFLEARQLHQEILNDCERVLGSDEPGTLRVLHDLAYDHGLTGDHATARSLFQRVFLEQSNASHSVSPVDVLASWNGLARELRLCGSYTDACDIGAEAYRYGRQELAVEHHQTLLTAKDLAIAHRKRGALTEALDLAQETHARLERRLGANHPDTLAAAITLSNSLCSVGRLEEAWEIEKTKAFRYPEVLGKDHPFSCAYMINVALLRRLRGDARAALSLSRQVYDRLTALDQSHDLLLACAVNLQSDLAATGATAEACELGKATLDSMRETLGMDHPLTLACAANLALDLAERGADEAARLHTETIERYEQVLGVGHLETGIVRTKGRINCDFDPTPL
ncbi:FxSxx-COOH system tetratricopeptide repeat protein [Nonomuraea sp. NPDC049625]|uniref:FxSxx-COOH system tetratricopeptide repeat protein n=1 Tax=Nonomuraea sp. NPDC049625 TaxID=3155775 RepID=UPI0034490380